MSTEGKTSQLNARTLVRVQGQGVAARIANLIGLGRHRRTLIAAALHVVLVWTMAAIVIWQNHRHSIDVWSSSAEKMAHAVTAHTEQTKRAADLVLNGIVHLIDEQDIRDEAQLRQIVGARGFHDRLRSYVVGTPQIGSATVLAVDGDVIGSSAQWPIAAVNLADREAFREALAADGTHTVVGVPVRARTDGRRLFHLARKLTTASGAPLGVVMVGIDVGYFATFFRTLLLGGDSWLSLFRSDGTLLATSLADEGLLGRRFDLPLAHGFGESGRSGVALLTSTPAPHESESTTTRIAIASKVEGFPSYVAVVIGESVYRTPVRTRNHLIVGIAAILTLLTVFAALRILRLIDRSEAMRRAESERQVLEAIVDTPSALTAVITPAGKVLRCNSRFREVFADGGDAGDVLLRPGLAGAAPLLAFAADTGARTGEIDLEYPAIQGTPRRLHFSLSRQALPETGDCVVMIGHDETQRHQAQQAIAMSARLVALGKITTSIAHEVSQPLNVIRMAAQNALAESAPEPAEPSEENPLPPMPDAEFRRFATTKLHRIVAQVDRAADILSRLRVFSRRPGENGHIFDAQRACRSALGLMTPELRRDGIRVKEEFPTEPLMASGSQPLMEQVLIYLLRNAREALIASACPDPTIEVSVQRGPAGRILIRVADNGPGIPATLREWIFEPFFTTRPNDNHMGLGLTVSFGAVRDFGGSLTLLPTDEGAAFQIDLPAPAPAVSVPSA